MATFGDTTAGGDTFPTSSDRGILSKFTPATSGIVTQINVRFDATSAAGDHFKGLIYASGGAAPGALLGVGSATAVPAGGGDLASTGLSVPVTAGVDYWIGSVVDGINSVWQCDVSGGLSRMEGVTYASPASSWTESGTGAGLTNAYATYTEATPLPKGKRANPREGFVRRPFDIAALLPRVRVESWFWQGWWPAPAGNGSVSGTGALVSGFATISGAGVTSSTGSGALTAQAAQASGAGASSSTGTGALVAQAAQVSGAGAAAWNATGALVSGSATISGAGVTSSTGSGALTAQAAQASGAGASSSTGTGALVAQAATVAGAGSVGTVIAGTGALVAGAAAMSGAGLSSSTATGALVAQAASLAGTGTAVHVAAGALQAQPAQVSGAGASSSTGTGALNAQAAQVSGAGTSATSGTGALVAGSAGIAGTGVAFDAGAITGTGALIAASASIAGAGEVVAAPIEVPGGGFGTRALSIPIRRGKRDLPAIDGTGVLVAGAAQIQGAGTVSGLSTQERLKKRTLAMLMAA